MNFNTKYNRQVYLDFLPKQFLPEDFHRTDEQIEPAFTPDRIKNITQIGRCDSLQLSVYEIQHESENDPRVTLSRETFKLLAELGNPRALVFFISQNSDNYRLSLVTVDLEWESGKRVKKVYSNPRRYSFFLGPDAKVHTVQEYLIKPGRVKDLDDLKKRFSIEVVNKDFYRLIAMRFTDLVGGSRKIGSRSYEKKGCIVLPIGCGEQKRKEFAVRLIGRLVFCWFLKKKHSEAGVPLIPKKILSLQTAKDNKNYYHFILEPLFFQTLNKKKEDRHEKYKSNGWDIIPFLNGGLFTPHEDDHYTPDSSQNLSPKGDVIVPNEWLVDLLELFDTYNFTIDESSSIDVELSIDPEMLGRIFENLLAEINPETGETARKATGSYYTPRPIVEYMVDQSIKQYLLTQTNIPEENIDSLLDYSQDTVDASLTDEQNNSIIDSLSKLKVLDPACGSGAFPMCVLQKMVLILQKVDPESANWLIKQLDRIPDRNIRKEAEDRLMGENWNYIHKLGIIKNSIYGVDIQSIAAEISKLRFFLSLIVDGTVNDDEDNRGIEPLPNLEFKFVCANTLVGLPEAKSQKGKMRGKKLVESKGQTSMFEATDDIAELKKVIDDYFISYGDKKIQLEEKFRGTQSKLRQHMLNWSGRETRTDTQTAKLADWNPFGHDSCPWFDPEWMFCVKDGFDVVIGNPPYVDSERMTKLMPGQREIISNLFITAKGNWDLYIPFWEATFNLLSKNGCASLITPNKWFAIKYGKKLREYLRRSLSQIANCDYINVFEAGNSPVIAFARKGMAKKYILIDCFSKSYLIDKQVKAKSSILDFDNWGMLLSRHTQLVLKIVNSEKMIQDYCIAENPFTVSEAYEVKKILLDLDKINSPPQEYFRFINTGTIDKYTSLWGRKLTTYIKTKYLQPIISKKEFLAKFPKRYKQMDSEKIVISGMRHFECLLDTNASLVAGKSTIILKPKSRISLKAFLGILNSKLITFYIKEAYGVLGIDGGINFTAGLVGNLPIPKLEKTKIQKIQTLADKILNITCGRDYLDSSVKQTSVKELENQIDQMVYKLYGLTNEEIEIVKNTIG